MNSIYLFGVLLPIYLLFNVGLAGIFKKAGQSPLLAFVPIVNLAIWTKALNRPVWWFLLLFVPSLHQGYYQLNNKRMCFLHANKKKYLPCQTASW